MKYYYNLKWIVWQHYLKCNLFLWSKLNFSASLLRFSVSHDPSQILLIYWFHLMRTLTLLHGSVLLSLANKTMKNVSAIYIRQKYVENLDFENDMWPSNLIYWLSVIVCICSMPVDGANLLLLQSASLLCMNQNMRWIVLCCSTPFINKLVLVCCCWPVLITLTDSGTWWIW